MNTKTLSASSLKGFCSVGLCWQFLYDVSSKAINLQNQQIVHGNIDLDHIVVEGQKFVLSDVTSSSDKTPAQDVWALAAAAFELMIGSPIFNGEGPAKQNAKTPIPRLPFAQAESLNELLVRCLNFQEEQRPSMSEIQNIAMKEKEVWQQKSRSKRIQNVARQQAALGKIDLQWSEQMLAKVVSVFLLLLCLSGISPLSAQITLNQNEEVVTQKLLDATLMLRHRDSKNWNAAQDEFEKRLAQFTLMNELQDNVNDCPLVSNQVKSFGVNRIVTELKRGRRVQNSGRELLDGADVRFNYSIYEKGVKQGRTATYTMSGRSGKQIFLVIPYSAKQAYETVLLKQDGTKIPVSGKDANGVTYYIIDTENGPAIDEKLTLKITNLDKKDNAAFVIINHNYRNK